MPKGDGKGWRKGQKIEIDYRLVKSLAAIQCTDLEMASILGIGHATFERRKKDDPDLIRAIEEGLAEGKVSLRRFQYKAAEGGNITMMIWLGKQFLEQKDRADLTSAGRNLKFTIKLAEDDDDDKAEEDEAGS